MSTSPANNSDRWRFGGITGELVVPALEYSPSAARAPDFAPVGARWTAMLASAPLAVAACDSRGTCLPAAPTTSCFTSKPPRRC
eukprot:1242930-Pleurochrysis_carterae.AAC.2